MCLSVVLRQPVASLIGRSLEMGTIMGSGGFKASNRPVAKGLEREKGP